MMLESTLTEIVYQLSMVRSTRKLPMMDFENAAASRIAALNIDRVSHTTLSRGLRSDVDRSVEKEVWLKVGSRETHQDCRRNPRQP